MRTLVLRTALTVLLSLGGGVTLAHAQLGGLGSIPSGSQLTLEPPYPGPGEEVTITLESLRHELGGSFISWAVDGEPVRSGVGETTLTVTLGEADERTRIDYAVEVGGRVVDQGTRVIQPIGLTLIWEPLTYTPHFYRGRAQHTTYSSVRLIAVPELADAAGNPIDPATLNYTWRVGPKRLAQQSGVGRRAIEVTRSGYGENFGITLSVSSPETGVNARLYQELPVAEPEVLFYEYDPLLGIRYNRLLTGVQIEDRGFSLVAEPFTYGTAQRDDSRLQWNWELAGEPLDADAFLQFSSPESGEATTRAALRLELTDRESITHRTRTTLPIQY
ncbi:hypothetical protein GVX82_03100 [Patescibacteria group bacterium]|nr:hypothetical protein [Patescibacteria group bacterium]